VTVSEIEEAALAADKAQPYLAGKNGAQNHCGTQKTRKRCRELKKCYYPAVIHLTKHERGVLVSFLILLLGGIAGKAWLKAHPGIIHLRRP
jgi:hypothetical protein